MICYKYSFGTTFACPSHLHIFRSWSLKWHSREKQSLQSPQCSSAETRQQAAWADAAHISASQIDQNATKWFVPSPDLRHCQACLHISLGAGEPLRDEYLLILLGHFLLTASSFKLGGIGSNGFLAMVYWTLNSLPRWSHQHKVVHLQVTL